MDDGGFAVLNRPSLHHIEEIIVVENEELGRFWETKKVLFVELLMWEEDRGRARQRQELGD
jgi:hypothetical protein